MFFDELRPIKHTVVSKSFTIHSCLRLKACFVVIAVGPTNQSMRPPSRRSGRIYPITLGSGRGRSFEAQTWRSNDTWTTEDFERYENLSQLSLLLLIPPRCLDVPLTSHAYTNYWENSQNSTSHSQIPVRFSTRDDSSAANAWGRSEDEINWHLLSHPLAFFFPLGWTMEWFGTWYVCTLPLSTTGAANVPVALSHVQLVTLVMTALGTSDSETRLHLLPTASFADLVLV